MHTHEPILAYPATATASAIGNETWVGDVCARGRSETPVGGIEEGEEGGKERRGGGL